MPSESTPALRPLQDLDVEELVAIASGKLTEAITSSMEDAPPDPIIQGLVKELRRRAASLYETKNPAHQRLFDLARELQAKTTVHDWESTYTSILKHRFPEPVTHEDNPLGLSSVVIGMRQLILNKKPILATGGMRFGLARVNPMDDRIVTLQHEDLIASKPHSLDTVHQDDVVPARKRRTIMRRVHELAESLRADARQIGCCERDARTFTDEWSLVRDCPKWGCFGGSGRGVRFTATDTFKGDSSDAETALLEALTCDKLPPAQLIEVVKTNISGILNAVNSGDVGEYGAQIVGSVRDGGRISRR